MTALPSQESVQLAVITGEAALAARVTDRFTRSKRISGAELNSVAGRWGEADVVCIWPVHKHPDKHPDWRPDWGRLLRNIASAHKPAVVLAAGAVAPLHSLHTDASPLPIARARDARGQSLTLTRLAGPEGITVSHPSVAYPDDAEAAWPGEIARACHDHSLPLAMLAMLSTLTESDDPEWRNLTSQKSLAGRLGAALGGVWRRPAFASEALSRLRQRMQSQDELVNRLEQLTAALTRTGNPLGLEPPQPV